MENFAMDQYMTGLKKYLESTKIGVVNLPRQADLLEAYELIKGIILAEDHDATVEIKHGLLQFGDVAIQIVTDDITVYDMRAFSKVIEKADNFQIYPTTDGKIKLDIMFKNVINYSLI